MREDPDVHHWVPVREYIVVKLKIFKTLDKLAIAAFNGSDFVC